MKAFSNILTSIRKAFSKEQNDSFKKAMSEYSHTHIELEPPTKRIGKGRGFVNNRKITRGRVLQEIKLENGKSRFIFHKYNTVQFN